MATPVTAILKYFSSSFFLSTKFTSKFSAVIVHFYMIKVKQSWRIRRRFDDCFVLLHGATLRKPFGAMVSSADQIPQVPFTFFSYQTLLWKTCFKCPPRESHSPSGFAINIVLSVNCNCLPLKTHDFSFERVRSTFYDKKQCHSSIFFYSHGF